MGKIAEPLVVSNLYAIQLVEYSNLYNGYSNINLEEQASILAEMQQVVVARDKNKF